MKYNVRLLTLSVALLLLVGLTKLPARAQKPDPQFDSAFASIPTAQKVDPANLDATYDSYIKVRSENADKNKELAADAVLRAALFAYDGLKALPERVMSPEAEHAQDKWLEEAQKAHDALRKLADGSDLPGTRAAKTVNEPLWPTVPSSKQPARMVSLREALESEIDHRNSQLPGQKGLGYKLIDGLVNMTGAVPGFSYWFALLMIAVIVKGLTFPLMLRTYKSQREMQKVSPYVKELQEKYKGKPELNEKMMALYKEHKINPFASCLPMLIQIPFLIMVYSTIRLYEYHFALGKFLWIGSSLSAQYPNYLATDMAKFDIPLLLIYAASNYLTMRLTPSPDPQQAQQQKTMSIMMTGMMLFFFLQYKWSAAFIFYWLVLNFISAFQSYYYVYKPNKIKLANAGANPITPDSTSVGGKGKDAGGSSSLTNARPAAVTPGGETMRPRPKRRGKR